MAMKVLELSDQNSKIMKWSKKCGLYQNPTEMYKYFYKKLRMDFPLKEQKRRERRI